MKGSSRWVCKGTSEAPARWGPEWGRGEWRAGWWTPPPLEHAGLEATPSGSGPRGLRSPPWHRSDPGSEFRVSKDIPCPGGAWLRAAQAWATGV